MALKYLKPENFSIISFNLDSLQIIKQSYPQIKTGMVIGTRLARLTQVFMFILNREKIFGCADEFSVNWKLWISGFTKLIPAKYPITVWTADETNLIKGILMTPGYPV